MTQHKPQTHPYRLLFEQIYQYRPRGGRRLANLFTSPAANYGPIGEALAPGTRDERPSFVANRPLEGRTIGQRWNLTGVGGLMHFSTEERSDIVGKCADGSTVNA